MSTFKDTEEQKAIFDFIKDETNGHLLIRARAGSGKCLGINTPVLMFDGTIKMVQEIKEGEYLMGDDSKPRKVINTNVGFGNLYRITPQKGDSWICNDVHIMSLYHETKKEIIDIPLNEISYTKYPNGNYRKLRLQRSGVEFKEKEISIDPYLLGIWLGDGTKEKGSPNFSINKTDNEVIQYLMNLKIEELTPKKKLINDSYYHVSITNDNYSGKTNNLRNLFKECINEDKSISIPKKYLINSRNNRLKLLAGLVDTDGYTHNNTIEISTKWESLKNDILFLARSLGFAAYAKLKKAKIKSLDFEGYYWIIGISGELDQIPIKVERKKPNERKQIKSVLRTGFKSEYIGKNTYYGFTLDGNGRFLLGDFTITHNTSTIVKSLNYIPLDKKILFLAFNKHITTELKDRVPSHVMVYTSHGLGWSAIRRKYKNAELDNDKIKKILNKKFVDPTGIKDMFKHKQNILKMCDLCRYALKFTDHKIIKLAERHDIFLRPIDVDLILSILEIAYNDRKTFDFADMVFIPAVDNDIFLFKNDYVIIDESQDLNAAQQKLFIKSLSKNGRFIIVGDDKQAIYGFSGSDVYSFKFYTKIKGITVLPLTTSFRCSKKVIEHAQRLVPDIKAMDNAPEGEVIEGNVLEDAQPNDWVLSRKNKPLIKLLFDFLKQDKKAVIRGADIGNSFISLIGNNKSIGQLNANLTNQLHKIEMDLRKTGIEKLESNYFYVNFKDTCDSLKYLGEYANNISNLKKMIGNIFKDSGFDGKIGLSTIHKFKGLESENVFIIKPEDIPLKTSQAWMAIQEKNLEYIAITRAKNKLIYDYHWSDE
ncbi:MAG: UvrD-helicase domain-containing protein [bacterium]